MLVTLPWLGLHLLTFKVFDLEVLLYFVSADFAFQPSPYIELMPSFLTSFGEALLFQNVAVSHDALPPRRRSNSFKNQALSDRCSSAMGFLTVGVAIGSSAAFMAMSAWYQKQTMSKRFVREYADFVLCVRRPAP